MGLEDTKVMSLRLSEELAAEMAYVCRVPWLDGTRVADLSSFRRFGRTCTVLPPPTGPAM
jgi:hypothetical protein